MIRLDVVQGSDEWRMARLGIPTASSMDMVITPKTLKPSTSAAKYLNRLLAEFLLGYPVDWSGSSQFMERGKELEPEAVDYYEITTGEPVDRVGLLLRDDRLVGCSPDGLVGSDGGLEIKCPAIDTHIGYLREPARLVEDYICQVQTSLYLTGRDWWDCLAYHPDLPKVVQRVEPDTRFQKEIGPILNAFVDELQQEKKRFAKHRRIAPTIAAVEAAEVAHV
jgi:hypothetical protein